MATRSACSGDLGRAVLAVMHPSSKTLGMGYYNVIMAQQDLKPRAKGGWETDLTLDQIAYLPPVNPNRFWMPSGK